MRTRSLFKVEVYSNPSGRYTAWREIARFEREEDAEWLAQSLKEGWGWEAAKRIIKEKAEESVKLDSVALATFMDATDVRIGEIAQEWDDEYGSWEDAD